MQRTSRTLIGILLVLNGLFILKANAVLNGESNCDRGGSYPSVLVENRAMAEALNNNRIDINDIIYFGHKFSSGGFIENDRGCRVGAETKFTANVSVTYNVNGNEKSCSIIVYAAAKMYFDDRPDEFKSSLGPLGYCADYFQRDGIN